MTVHVLTNVANDPGGKNFSAILTAAASPVASAIYLGFTPNHIILQQVGGAADATWRSEWHKGMTAAYSALDSNSSQGTLPTTNGFTILTGNEVVATVAARATGSPGTDGLGVIVGTGVVAANLVYNLTAYK